jgi:hypothetical protein
MLPSVGKNASGRYLRTGVRGTRREVRRKGFPAAGAFVDSSLLPTSVVACRCLCRARPCMLASTSSRLSGAGAGASSSTGARPPSVWDRSWTCGSVAVTWRGERRPPFCERSMTKAPSSLRKSIDVPSPKSSTSSVPILRSIAPTDPLAKLSTRQVAAFDSYIRGRCARCGHVILGSPVTPVWEGSGRPKPGFLSHFRPISRQFCWEPLRCLIFYRMLFPSP